MSHIAIDARIINTSTGRYVERLVTHLEQIDSTNQYTVLVLSKDLNYWQPKNKNFTVQAADFDQYSMAEQFGLLRHLNKLKPDLVHFCMPQQPALYRGKHVTTFHDLSLIHTYNSDKNWFVYHFKQWVGGFIFRRVAHTSQHVLTPSQYTKDDLLQFVNIPEDKVTVTYEAADLTTAGSRQYKPGFKKYLLYVGQQSDYKNIKRLGDAHQKLLRKYPDLGLVLVGKKNASALINESYFVKKKYKNILFTDFLPDDQLNYLYQHATTYVFPSLMEGFGLPGLEAMAQGLPVISSQATCLPEVYGKAAHYFNPTNVDDIADKIDEVLSDEKLRLSLVKEGFKQIKKYSWKRMAQQTHAIYKDVLS